MNGAELCYCTQGLLLLGPSVDQRLVAPLPPSFPQLIDAARAALACREQRVLAFGALDQTP